MISHIFWYNCTVENCILLFDKRKLLMTNLTKWKCCFMYGKYGLLVFRVHGVFKRIVSWIWLRYDRTRVAHFYCYLSSLTNTMFIWLHPGLGRYLSQPDGTNERSTRLATTFCWQYLFFLLAIIILFTFNIYLHFNHTFSFVSFWLIFQWDSWELYAIAVQAVKPIHFTLHDAFGLFWKFVKRVKFLHFVELWLLFE